MVHAAVTDVIGPSVATEGPDGLLTKHVPHIIEGLELRLVPLTLREGLGQGLCQRRTSGTGALHLSAVVQPLLGTEGHRCGGCLILRNGTGQVCCRLLTGVDGQVHTIAKLCTILQQGVFPSGPSPLFVYRIGGGRCAAAPDRGASGGIGNVHPVPEQLGYQLNVGGLTATSASAGEFKERLLELAALHRFLGEGEVLLGNLFLAVVVNGLLVHLRIQRLHGQCLGLCRACLHAGAAASAVQHRNRHGIGIDFTALTTHVVHFDVLGGRHHFVRIHYNGPDAGVGADIGADVALDAAIRIPLGNRNRNAPFLKRSSALRQRTVGTGHQLRDRNHVTPHSIGRDHHVFHILGQFLPIGVDLRLHHFVLRIGPPQGDHHFLHTFNASVYRIVVAHDHVHTLVAVTLDDSVLHVLYGFFHGDHLCQLEEGSLQDGVGAVAHAQFNGLVGHRYTYGYCSVPGTAWQQREDAPPTPAYSRNS